MDTLIQVVNESLAFVGDKADMLEGKCLKLNTNLDNGQMARGLSNMEGLNTGPVDLHWV